HRAGPVRHRHRLVVRAAAGHVRRDGGQVPRHVPRVRLDRPAVDLTAAYGASAGEAAGPVEVVVQPRLHAAPGGLLDDELDLVEVVGGQVVVVLRRPELAAQPLPGVDEELLNAAGPHLVELAGELGLGELAV